DEPHRAGCSDHCRHASNTPFAPRVPLGEYPQHWKNDGEDSELSDLHAEVERKERERHPSSRQIQRAERSGESEAMDEPERKRDLPTSFHARPPQILHTDVEDRKGDGRLDEDRTTDH